jgi:quercetin dioxygenase-like cupin family protein
MAVEGLAGAVQMGAKLRQFRLAKRLTLKEVASRADCSESMLSKVENDRITPSIGLLQGERPFIVRNAGAEGSDVSLELLTPSPGPVLFQANIHTVPPRCRSDGRIVHKGEDFGYVLEGTLELSVGDQIYALKAGDTFYFPSELPHGYRNAGKTTLRVLWFNTPATF